MGKYLSLTHFFDGTTPMLSCIKLLKCDINRQSPVLKGLKHLEIRNPCVRPSLSAWLDALDEMHQHKTLVSHWASPIVPRDASLPFDVERTRRHTFLPHTLFSKISSLSRERLWGSHSILPCVFGATRPRTPQDNPTVTEHAIPQGTRDDFHAHRDDFRVDSPARYRRRPAPSSLMLRGLPTRGALSQEQLSWSISGGPSPLDGH